MKIVIDIPEEVIEHAKNKSEDSNDEYVSMRAIEHGTPYEERTHGECCNCNYFKYDVVQNVAGMPFIVAHEMCTKWGEGCKTSVNGYCFLYEPKEGGADNEVQI